MCGGGLSGTELRVCEDISMNGQKYVIFFLICIQVCTDGGETGCCFFFLLLLVGGHVWMMLCVFTLTGDLEGGGAD